MAALAACGVFVPGLYRDNALISHTFRGQDVVTLLVTVPLLVLGLVTDRRGSARGRVGWAVLTALGVASATLLLTPAQPATEPEQGAA
jgi:hypothetical protein